MHAAPAVSYPAGRHRLLAVASLLLWAVGAALVATWIAGVREPGGRHAFAAACVFLVGVAAFWNWRRTPGGLLAWDGVGWTWTAGREPETGWPDVALDLQSVLLLRWRSDRAGTRWLWLARGTLPAHWDALRRAVYSRARPGAPEGAQAPVAER